MYKFDLSNRLTSSKLGLTPIALDVLCLGSLILFTLIALLWNYSGLPMQYWDESRNASNALEMVLGSNWLMPTYDGQVDHWNTKPPLLIWIMASLMKLGLSPLLAVRLPSVIATLATLTMVWGAIRFGLGDKLAAFVAAALMLSSTNYMGLHGAHTGDFDTLLAFFTTAYVLSMWQALIRQGRAQYGWMLSMGICLTLAVMTKGPAGLFGLVGLGLFVVINGQLLPMLKEWRWWIVILCVCLICATYYLMRDFYDQGYLHAVWENELAGRYNQTNEAHYGGLSFYVVLLLKEFEPGSLLLPLASLTLLGKNTDRKQLLQITLWTGLGIIILLSCAQTQLRWYLVPVIPILSITAAIAFTDALRYFQLRPAIIRTLLIIIVTLPLCVSLYKNTISIPSKAQHNKKISQYGVLFEKLHLQGTMPYSITVIDEGIDNSAGFANYNPVLHFYTLLEQQKGIDVKVVKYTDKKLADAFVASCDYKIIDAVHSSLKSIVFDNGQCVAGYLGTQ